VPYEIGFSRSQGVASAFLITDQVDVLNQLPQYATISSLYASIDELARWTATLAGKDLHTDLTGIPPGVLEQLAKFVPMDPPRPDLSVLCERALNAIALLDNVETHRVLALTTQSFEWLPTTGGPISELAYDLLAPLAYFKLGLTTLPGQRSHLQLVYELPTLHYRIAAQEPEVPYAPEVLGWKSLRYRTPETTWLQGLTKEQLDERIVNFLCTRTRAGDLRLATRAEFKAEFQRIVTSNVERSRRSLGVLINPLLGFTPMTRPVYWRILAIQHQLYSDMLGRNIPGLFSRETANAAQSFLVGHPFLST
jgi:hypothetical protein